MDILKKMLELLSKQTDTQKKLLSLEEKKTRVLSAGTADELDEILRFEQPLLMQSESLEKSRLSLMEGAGLQGADLGRVVRDNAADNPLLLERFDELRGLLTKLKQINRMNMSIVRARLDAMATPSMPSGEVRTTYDKSGNLVR